MLAALGDQHFAVGVQCDGGADDQMRDFSLFLFHGEIGLRSFNEGGANAGERALFAMGRGGCAGEGAELHERFVVASGVALRQKRVGPFLDLVFAFGERHVAAECVEPGEYADHVPVDHGEIEVEGEASDGGGSVRSDARQAADRFGGARELSVEVGDDGLGGFMKIACAGVVAESFPCFKDLVLGGVGELLDAAESFHEAEVIRLGLRNAGLLKHDFGNPDAVGGAIVPPRHRPFILGEPV